MNRYYSLATDGDSAEVCIFGDITPYPWEGDMSAYNLSKQLEEIGDVKQINVHINSYGGEVAEGLAIYNALRNHKAKVTTICDGFACSIASVIFMSGDNRVMNDSSLLMIHNAWTFAEGNADQLRKQADDLEKINEASVKAYLSKVSITEEELKALMDNETWISPEDAVEYGFATDVKRDDSDKPSQNARKKVQKMILNPYQMEDEEKDPEDEHMEAEAPDMDDPDEPEVDPDDMDDTDNTDDMNDPDDMDDPDDPEGDPDEDTEDDPNQKKCNKDEEMQYAFFKAIQHM